jgi:hypothetical protein
LQDRLVKERRLAGISSIAAANAWLPGFITGYNARFGRDPANAKDLHRPVRAAKYTTLNCTVETGRDVLWP